jgi:hypothetical protein
MLLLGAIGTLYAAYLMYQASEVGWSSSAEAVTDYNAPHSAVRVRAIAFVADLLAGIGAIIVIGSGYTYLNAALVGATGTPQFFLEPGWMRPLMTR